MAVKGIRRNTTFDWSRRSDSTHIGGMEIPWYSEIISEDGAHYHCWILRNHVDFEDAMQEKFMRAARRHGDPVSFSWDYIPREVCDSARV
jgi:hypothetical protein